MRKYLDLLDYIYSKEQMAFSRKMAFGCTLRLNLQEGFPIVTTRPMSVLYATEKTLDFLYQQPSEVKHAIDRMIALLLSHRLQYPSNVVKSTDLMLTLPQSLSFDRHPFMNPTALQFHVQNGRLDCMINEPEMDIFNALPFAIVGYAMIVHMLAQQLDIPVGEIIWSGGQCFLRTEDFAAVHVQLMKTPRPLSTFAICRHPDTIWDYTASDFEYIGYSCCTP